MSRRLPATVTSLTGKLRWVVVGAPEYLARRGRLDIGLDDRAAPVDNAFGLTERELGVSKMSGSNIREALVKVAKWGVQSRTNGARAARAANRT